MTAERGHRLLLSNLGYARGIDGSLESHMRHAYRYIYCPRKVQNRSIESFKELIRDEDPDLCCLIEIDKGSLNSAFFNQMKRLAGPDYPFHDVENKYGESSMLRTMPVSNGKCNGFLAKRVLPFEKIFFTVGTKRLIYKIKLAEDLTLFFSHFSLRRQTRESQFREFRRAIDQTPGEIVILGDFNIFDGYGELEPLLDGTDLRIVSEADEPTFFFDGRGMTLDLCLCSASLANRTRVRVREQDFSDHFAVVVDIAG